MKVLVCGGRDFDNAALMRNVFEDNLEGEHITCLIEGGARGADRLARVWAEQHEITVVEFPANWDYLGLAAGQIRNRAMLDIGKPDFVIAFPGGAGTAGLVREAKKRNIPILEVKA
jgi:hypothetical protein